MRTRILPDHERDHRIAGLLGQECAHCRTARLLDEAREAARTRTPEERARLAEIARELGVAGDESDD